MDVIWIPAAMSASFFFCFYLIRLGGWLGIGRCWSCGEWRPPPLRFCAKCFPFFFLFFSSSSRRLEGATSRRNRRRKTIHSSLPQLMIQSIASFLSIFNKVNHLAFLTPLDFFFFAFYKRFYRSWGGDRSGHPNTNRQRGKRPRLQNT